MNLPAKMGKHRNSSSVEGKLPEILEITEIDP